MQHNKLFNSLAETMGFLVNCVFGLAVLAVKYHEMMKNVQDYSFIPKVILE